MSNQPYEGYEGYEGHAAPGYGGYDAHQAPQARQPREGYPQQGWYDPNGAAHPQQQHQHWQQQPYGAAQPLPPERHAQAYEPRGHAAPGVGVTATTTAPT